MEKREKTFGELKQEYYRTEQIVSEKSKKSQVCLIDVHRLLALTGKVARAEKQLLVKRLIVFMVISLTVFFQMGCQLVQGVGRDITWIGNAGQHVLENASDYK